MLKRLLLAALVCFPAPAQTVSASDWAVHFLNEFETAPNITYLTANNYEAKLDVYKRRDATGPQPTLIWIHGGGWTGGVKDNSLPFFAPWLEMGWQVVNVEYRLAKISPAPAAVEDCLCALRWVAGHAKQYNFDTTRLVVSGDSAGGHLALTTGMIPESAGYESQCPGARLPKVAAIVNWYGITDVADLLQGPNTKDYAIAWMGNRPDRAEAATRLSPLHFIRKDLPPILTIHGDADPVVPYSHAQRLQAELERAGVPHQLVTVPGGKHGYFTPEERSMIYTEIRAFLAKYKLPARNP